MGVKAQKCQSEMVGHMRKSTEFISLILDEIKDSNSLMREPNSTFEQTAAELAGLELLKSLELGSPERMEILDQIMRKRVAQLQNRNIIGSDQDER